MRLKKALLKQNAVEENAAATATVAANAKVAASNATVATSEALEAKAKDASNDESKE